MKVEQVDVVGLQGPEAFLHPGDDVLPPLAGLVGLEAPGVGHLGGDHRVLPLPLQGFAQEDLALAPGVAVRGIEEVHPLVQGMMDDADGFPLVRLVPEGHGAQTEAGDLQPAAPDQRVFHIPSSFFSSVPLSV